MPRSSSRGLWQAFRVRTEFVSVRTMPDQPEVDDRHDSLVVEGEDADHVLPPQELDPFTPEPGPPAKARAALLVALVIVVVMVAVVLYVAVR